MIRMQGIPEQNAVGLPAYVNRMGGIRVLFVEDDEVYCANLVADCRSVSISLTRHAV
jgi:hypothetical protein